MRDFRKRQSIHWKGVISKLSQTLRRSLRLIDWINSWSWEN